MRYEIVLPVHVERDEYVRREEGERRPEARIPRDNINCG